MGNEQNMIMNPEPKNDQDWALIETTNGTMEHAYCKCVQFLDK